ncbi:Similar to Emg1: Ribosomal RNA small subunit methyltransferase NEP1 (Mus musculus) [Cotesia congregata]|uniref:Similar to Emg1: Ribosomal RNA small subunit methyltransferase NEP1 (Mus musculus) n=1 Tax=Cotesia congregata TaxID=51543 RepID=A0A8J2HMT8_COTCN|nr:Similar to Emg1: Ribosomal RNA small subunit methyltransferase NEP1 (Mus musculus) [Cotesia congregata]
MSKKRQRKTQYNENEYDVIPKSLKVMRNSSQKKRLIVILENAQLETVKVYVHTKNNVLFEVDRFIEVPTYFDEFAELMVCLLHKHKIRAVINESILLKVIKNPITDWLPAGCKKILMSFSADKIKDPKELVPDDEPISHLNLTLVHGLEIPEHQSVSNSWVSRFEQSIATDSSVDFRCSISDFKLLPSADLKNSGRWTIHIVFLRYIDFLPVEA